MTTPMRSASSGAPAIDVTVDAGDFKRLLDRSSQVDKALRNNLRKEIRTSARGLAAKVQDTVRLPPSRPSISGMSGHTGLRDAIASGIGVSILTGNTRIGVQITASGRNLPANAKGLVRAYDRRGGWRHPVYGNADVFVDQYGRPYFADVINAGRAAVTTVVIRAMREAIASIEQ